MRTPVEALGELRDRLVYFCARTDGTYSPSWATELVGIIDDALKDNVQAVNGYEAHAAPKRNCDVGTADEQKKRFRKFCDSHSHCAICKFGELGTECGVAWSQMPYEKGEAK